MAQEEITEEIYVVLDFEDQPSAESLLAKASSPGAAFSMIEDRLVLECPSHSSTPVQIQCTPVDTVGTDLLTFISADQIHMIGSAKLRLLADQVARID